MSSTPAESHKGGACCPEDAPAATGSGPDPPSQRHSIRPRWLLAQRSGVDPKAARAVRAALQAATVCFVHIKESGGFTVPGPMKIGPQRTPAQKNRFGKDPFTSHERWFPAKPALVKVKTRDQEAEGRATL